MAKYTYKELKYLRNQDFLVQYLNILNSRLVYSNNLIEEDNGPIGKLYTNDSILTLNDNFKAFAILLKKLKSSEEKVLTVDLIKEVANTINKHTPYIKEGYRTIGDNIKFEGKYPIEKSSDIESAMEELLEKYYGEWSLLDIFEREARFNVEFLRIHPFEDGNGRTSRLILNYNVIRQGHAPILMPEGIREDYFKARNREDIRWIKRLFKNESKKELLVIQTLIESYKDDLSNNNRSI